MFCVVGVSWSQVFMRKQGNTKPCQSRMKHWKKKLETRTVIFVQFMGNLDWFFCYRCILVVWILNVWDASPTVGLTKGVLKLHRANTNAYLSFCSLNRVKPTWTHFLWPWMSLSFLQILYSLSQRSSLQNNNPSIFYSNVYYVAAVAKWQTCHIWKATYFCAPTKCQRGVTLISNGFYRRVDVLGPLAHAEGPENASQFSTNVYISMKLKRQIMFTQNIVLDPPICFSSILTKTDFFCNVNVYFRSLFILLVHTK